MIKLNKKGTIIFSAITVVVVCLIALLIKFCWPISIVVGLAYIGFITFINVIDSMSKKVIKTNNEEIEKYAKENNLEIKYISPKEYKDLMEGKGGLSFDNNILINKKDVNFI